MGAGLSVGLSKHIYLDERISVALLGFLSVLGLCIVRSSRGSWLPRLYIVAYAAPFAATVGCLTAADYVWWPGDAASSLIRVPAIRRSMLMAGAIGLCGLVAGLQLVFRGGGRPAHERRVTLGAPAFLMALGLAVGFSALAAPPASILTVKYGVTESPAERFNFNSAAVVSYIAIVILYLDVETRRVWSRSRAWRAWTLAAGVCVIVVYFQLLRGDRECIGLIIALAVLHVTSPSKEGQTQSIPGTQRRRSWLFFSLAMFGAAVFVLIGFVRTMLAPGGDPLYSLPHQLRDVHRMNTWTAVLLTDLGAAREFVAGTPYLHGETYRDYVLSLPPGLVMRLLKARRPIERDRGPQWWNRDVTIGGVHIIVVPWRNFGPPGILVFMTVIGWMIASIDRLNGQGALYSRIAYGTFAAAALQWFWYGDMNVIRAVMVAVILGALYSTACSWRLLRARRWE